MIKVIAGLGNPGTKYATTRHNVGFLAIDRLLQDSPAISERSMHSGLLYETAQYGLLCKPLTYMNRSGKALLSIAKDLQIEPAEILILYDDFALELGSIRIRPHGSSGGHHGLQSVIDCLGTTHVPRVRLGINSDDRMSSDEWIDFVLTDFRKGEKAIVAEMLDNCAEAVDTIVKDGITMAMNRFNRKQKLVQP